MKNKRGFTLVELLSTILILGILLSASIFAVTRFVGKSKVESMEVQKRSFVMAAKAYAQDHQKELPSAIGENRDIKARTIKNAKYLKNDLKNADGKSCMEKSLVRVHKYDEFTYTYVAYVICEGDTDSNMEPPAAVVVANISDNGFVEVILKDDEGDANEIGLASWDYTIVAHYRDSGITSEVYRSESIKLNGEETYTTSIDLSPYEVAGATVDFDVIVVAYNLAGGRGTNTATKMVCTRIHLSSSSLFVLKGESKTVTFTSDCGNRIAQWSSSDSSIAVVDNGIITGVNTGETTITVTLPGGVSEHLTVEVGACTSLSLTPNAFSLRRGEIGNITISKDCPKEVQWSSSNPSVATVDNGVVTAIAAGNAVITGTLVDGVTSTVDVGVCAPSISITPAAAVVPQGGTTTISVNKQCTDSAVTWTSSNPSVATVDNGVVTGISTGDAVITATVDGVSSTVNVNVPTCSYLHLDSSSLSLQKGKTKTMTVDKDCDNPVSWQSSDTSVVTVADGVLTGVQNGNAVVTATLMDGITATVDVNVCTPSISISPASATISEGSTKQLTATTSCLTSAVTWKSSNTSKATVSSTGRVTGVNWGSASITASADGVSARCSITVQINLYPIG